jgi:L-asparagine transporter-like permease
VFAKTTQHMFYRNAWVFVSAAMIVIVGISYFVKGNLFGYLISACSYFTFLNWSVNLLTYLTWRKRCADEEVYRSPLMAGKIGAVAALLSILILVVFSLKMKDFRIGFYVAFAISSIISLLYWSRKIKKTY